MSTTKVLEQYFGPAGTYVDPAVPEGASGAALVHYLAEHYRAFPDARYEIATIAAGNTALLAYFDRRGMLRQLQPQSR